ncbi:hypothetical protein [Helicobacter sp. L8]|uniref:hypothetical protein n=1 Tax=Helicobacter sp. L8 TaxID=2316078 RepID=UPI000EB52644|nr:hypothetical protein [Helicobacter sp. L8]
MDNPIESVNLPANLDPLKKARSNARPEQADLPKDPAMGLFEDLPSTPKPTPPKTPQIPPCSGNLLRVAKIESAIQDILDNLAKGIEISKYEIDGIRVEKRSPLELINQLERLKMRLSAKPLPRYLQYKF